MKKITTLVFLAAALLAAACQNDTPTDRDDAIKVLDAKIKKHPKDAELYYQRGALLLQSGKATAQHDLIDQAVADLTLAVKLDDSKSSYFTALGDAHFASGNVGLSYSALQNALQLDPDNLEAALKMGEISFYSRDYDRAMESLSKVTEKDKNNQTALFMKGFIYKEKGDTANAAYYFRKVADLYPDYEPALEELGVLYSQHNPKVAIDYFNTALQLTPNNTNTLYNLAILYQDMAEADQANDLYVKILEIDPQYKYAWFNRGWLALVYYEDYPAAVDFFTKALDCDNQYTDALYNCGVAYEMMGDQAKAQACYSQTLAIDPQYPKLQ